MPCLVVPAVASASVLTGAAIEDVHLLRDETADMAWAIEYVVEGPLGDAESEPLPPAPEPAAGARGLVYQLSTPLPVSWYPLMPVQVNGAVNLLAGSIEGQALPRGRIVSRLGAAGFQMPDGEVPRSGVRVRRIVCRARSADGQSHLWIARRRQIGAGAASARTAVRRGEHGRLTGGWPANQPPRVGIPVASIEPGCWQPPHCSRSNSRDG